MAKGVVDRLEIIEVEEEDGDAAVGVCLQRVVEMDTEGGPVRQVGERVVERLVGQFLLQGLALTDVSHVEDETPHRRQLEQVGDRYFSRAVGVVLPAKA